jgi:hypothetical protein
MMFTSNVFRIILAMGMFACAQGKRGEFAAQAPPPAEKVKKGLETAKEHAANLYAAAMSTQQEINKVMEKAVADGQMVDFQEVMKLNNAIQKSANAKELEGLVNDHFTQANEFFNLVNAFTLNKEQMKIVRDELEAEHSLQAANSEAEVKEAKDAMEAATTALIEKQNTQEEGDLSDLLAKWADIQSSHGEIKTKSEALNADVHPKVTTGTKAVEEWANGETASVCTKKKAEDAKMFTAGSSCSMAVGGGSLMEVKDSSVRPIFHAAAHLRRRRSPVSSRRRR